MKSRLSSFASLFVWTLFHLFVTFLLFIHVLTSIWYLQQLWSDNDDTNYQMSLITKKFTYSIRSWLLICHLQ